MGVKLLWSQLWPQAARRGRVQRPGKGEGAAGPTEGPPQVQGDKHLSSSAHYSGSSSSPTHDPCSLQPGKREKEPSLLVSPESDPLLFSDFLPGAGGQESG